MKDSLPQATGQMQSWQRVSMLLKASDAGSGLARVSTLAGGAAGGRRLDARSPVAEGEAGGGGGRDARGPARLGGVPAGLGGGPAGLGGGLAEADAALPVLEALKTDDVAGSAEQHAVGQLLYVKLNGLLTQLSIFEQVSHCPVVAITGLLNAGKSTLLATYLSEAGRARVLRGVSNQQGTHRFVIWMPQLWWRDPELLNTLIGYLTSVFGHPPEQLSEDIQVAQQQYNGQIVTNFRSANSVRGYGAAEDASVDAMAVPLIASDPALDALQLGLVDCPDIQTGFMDHSTVAVAGVTLAAARRSQLSKIGRLCSAFLVVSKLSSLHDDGLLQLLTTLRDAMPGVPRILAINKVKGRYAPEVVFEESRGLLDRFGIASVFAAYDYRSATSRDRIPAAPAGLQTSTDQPQPIFYEVTSQSQTDSNRAIKSAARPQLSPRDYLYHLSMRLEAGNLAKESHRSLALQLQAAAAESLEWLMHNEGLRRRQLTFAWQAISDACYDFMAERNSDGQATGLRLQASPAIIAQLADSLQRTAPVWMRFSMSIDRTARQFQQAISNSASRFKILQSASNTVMQFTKSFRRGEGAQVVTPQRLAEAIRNYDYQDALGRLSDEQLKAGCEVAMKRFAAEDKSLLDAKQLDTWSTQIWSNMPLKQKLWKGTQPLALLMAPLLAAVLVPIDGGGTAVLVFASAKELLAAAGVAVLLGPTLGGSGALKIVHRETPWRQLSDLFAVVCDSLGVPRPAAEHLPRSLCEGESRQLLNCNLPATTTGGQAMAITQWRMSDEFVRTVRAAIQTCC